LQVREERGKDLTILLPLGEYHLRIQQGGQTASQHFVPKCSVPLGYDTKIQAPNVFGHQLEFFPNLKGIAISQVPFWD